MRRRALVGLATRARTQDLSRHSQAPVPLDDILPISGRAGTERRGVSHQGDRSSSRRRRSDWAGFPLPNVRGGRSLDLRVFRREAPGREPGLDLREVPDDATRGEVESLRKFPAALHFIDRRVGQWNHLTEFASPQRAAKRRWSRSGPRFRFPRAVVSSHRAVRVHDRLQQNHVAGRADMATRDSMPICCACRHLSETHSVAFERSVS